MASTERTAALLEGAGFGDATTAEVVSRFVLSSVDEDLSVIADTAGPIALAIRGLSSAERADVRAEVEDSVARFAAADCYELPCVALCAVGR